MSKSWQVLFFTQIMLFSVLSLHSAYATTEITDGTIAILGCHIINGNITNEITSMHGVQMCHYKNFNFQIKELSQDAGCIQVLVYWKDPDSGHVYTFPNP